MKFDLTEEHFAEHTIRVDIVKHGPDDYSATLRGHSMCIAQETDRDVLLNRISTRLALMHEELVHMRLNMLRAGGKEDSAEAQTLQEVLRLIGPSVFTPTPFNGGDNQ